MHKEHAKNMSFSDFFFKCIIISGLFCLHLKKSFCMFVLSCKLATTEFSQVQVKMHWVEVGEVSDRLLEVWLRPQIARSNSWPFPSD